MITQQRKVACWPYVKQVARAESPWDITSLCKAYNWPQNLTGAGVIAIVELGGGWVPGDMTRFFGSIGQPTPSITDVSVDGTNNSQQRPQNDADYEVALDIQIAGAAYYLATGRAANIRVYWAQDIAPAVAKAAADGCDVCTISWGNDEAAWGNQACIEMEAAAAAAIEAGMIVFAAAGDNDSSDGGPNSANVDCPASCPHVVGCGGTTKTPSSEVVWNNNPGATNGEGTGGGYSTVFPHQNWQLGAPPAPVSVAGDPSPGRGRMVPDVAANADPNTGYEITVYGQTVVVGGTSAVAPLYAGLFAAFGKKIGFVSRKVWKPGERAQAFTDITLGSNGVYKAGIGPDPCTGVGAVNGAKLAGLGW